MVKVCITGCLHGELDRVYTDIASAEKVGQFKTDLVLCCGDFQSVRNVGDLASMSVPPKYCAMGDFWKYYAEEMKAPIPTVFVGGNHEASSYLHELPYGGWVAPNIWYMGFAGVIQFAGLRIAGLSGIYKQHDYTMGHYERPPYSESTKRSVYHIRNLEVFRLGQLRRRLDIVLSHDWPRGIYHYGDTGGLLQRKRHFREEIDTESLGSPPGEQLFCRLQPRYWFAAHLHCKFAAVVEHAANDASNRSNCTRFLALDKCLPNRDYLQFLDIEPDPCPVAMSSLNADESALHCDNDDPVIVAPAGCPAATTTASSRSSSPSTPEGSDRISGEEQALGTGFYLDPEWLCVLRTTNHLMSTHQVPCILPGANERCDFSVNRADMHSLLEPFGGHFAIPENFERTAPMYKPDEVNSSRCSRQSLMQQANTAVQAALAKEKIRPPVGNPQTELMCAMLDLLNPMASRPGDGARQRDAASLLENSYRLAEDDDDDSDDEDGCQGGDRAQPPGYGQTDASSFNLTDEYDPRESSVAGTDSVRLSYPSANRYDELDTVSSLMDVEDAANRTDYSINISHNPEELSLGDDEDDEDSFEVGATGRQPDVDVGEYKSTGQRTEDTDNLRAYSPSATVPPGYADSDPDQTNELA